MAMLIDAWIKGSSEIVSRRETYVLHLHDDAQGAESYRYTLSTSLDYDSSALPKLVGY